ncbi:hypothetical protein TVAG_535860 [Trichomonas vaginalis G3]|uniref:Uncharacterized protein n=1 Tax=Trichomonas vaginalis (strain ATCC PRA-98 / G3) TaxID=412133 RepID=A2HZC7_TRIV3|nr:hypothetical protein TVAGG3_0469440 [Trichomonas vaginalis G3]EAX65239.1 hypothetical protein TVAG_535860 [Trichomonas vaginalis G3]KAI5514965.1 hypothetical protein TVAGG3_0469440 [Trichomonas vaginalis G3]|eukprot:XP_001278169.1 hypothetical protein [Trichomonas vaginalis G3]
MAKCTDCKQKIKLLLSDLVSNLSKFKGGILSKTVPNKYKTTPDEYAKEVENDD